MAPFVRTLVVAIFGVLIAAVTTPPAGAIPLFAHRYGFSCQVCHTEVPHLTPFGETFLANGYRIPGLKPRPVFPVAMRAEGSYASAGAADPDEASSGPLPKTIVNEVELLTGGAIGSRVSYWAEAYVVDGGEPGRPRDVWAAYRVTPDNAKIPVTARLGEFTLPLPLDPETFRETTQPYAIWSQTAGSNPFNFFAVKGGGEITVGQPSRGLSGTAALITGHDTASGLPTFGVDTMFALQRNFGSFGLSAYRYDGSRPVFGPLTLSDRFWRNGFGVNFNAAGTSVDAVYQIGNDTVADIYSDDLVTSGGFVQVRRELSRRTFAIARWDATRDAGFARSVTAGFGYRPSRNTRLTIFETAQRDYNGRLLHILSSSFLVAL